MVPTLKKLQALTSSFSRRRAMSHRIVAREPVTDRFGPRSIPISIALASCFDMADACSALAPISPTGRLLIRFEPTAKTEGRRKVRAKRWPGVEFVEEI